MLVLLPFLTLSACVLGWSLRLCSWREGAIAGAVTWGVLLIAITETLSGYRALTPLALAIAWSLGAAAACIYVARERRPWPAWRLAALDLVFLTPLAAMVLVLAAITLLSPPNTWDAMTYHLARVAHWQQNASLAPYTTHILRQLYLQPGAEFVLLHLRMLSGTDVFSGTLQLASMVGSLIGASLIAGLFGAARASQVCAAVVAASVPIGILEATSTQNDHVVTFWVVCFVCYILRVLQRPSLRWSDALLLGSSLGLALLTKATAYIVALPFLVWLVLSLLRRQRLSALPPLAIAACVAITLNAGAYARNVSVFGTPTGPPDEGAPSLRYFNDAITPSVIASNLVRDVGLNFVATPFAAINVRALHFVQAIHAVFGMDIQEPRSTWGGEQFREEPVGLAFDENFAGNPLHVLLLLVAVVAVWPLQRATLRISAMSGRHAPGRTSIVSATGAAAPPSACSSAPSSGPPPSPDSLLVRAREAARTASRPPSPTLSSSATASEPPEQKASVATVYALALIAGFVLFAVMLRWQPWHTRLELPFFVLAAPLVAAVAQRISPRIALSLAALLLVSMLPWVAYNQARPLVGPRSIVFGVSRSDQYFTNQPGLRVAYQHAIDFLASRGCNDIGFISTGDGWEYPIWALYPSPVNVHHVGVGNLSGQLDAATSPPNVCAVFSLEPTINQLATLDVGGGRLYRTAWHEDQVSILTRDAR